MRTGELDERSASAYRLAALHGRFVPEDIAKTLLLTPEETSQIQQTLIHLHLLTPAKGSPHDLIPASPDAAVAELVGDSESQIRALQRAVTDIRSSMLSLMPAYFEGRRQRNRTESFDIVTDVNAIRALLHEHRVQAEHEILSVQPGGAEGASLLASLRDTTLETLDRGVVLRTLYQHSARGDPSIRSYVREVTARGAEIRTTGELVDRMMIYDRQVAFLPEQSKDGPGRSAVVIREPNLVAFLCKIFTYQWHSAAAFTLNSGDTEPVADDLKRSILDLMSRGYKDEMVARRLGMSVRTCRRHIAEVTESLHAVSRFQAGFNAALSGQVSPDGTAAEY